MASVAAPTMMQAKPKAPVATGEVFRSRGKRSLKIQMGTSPGMNIPGT